MTGDAEDKYLSEKERIAKKHERLDEERAQREYKRRLASARNAMNLEKAKQDEVLRITKQADKEYLAELKAAAEQEERERKSELLLLKANLATGELSQSQYYDALAQYRDKYFEKGSDEWNKYTTQIVKYNKEMTDGIGELHKELSDSIKSYGDGAVSDAKATFLNQGPGMVLENGVWVDKKDLVFDNSELNTFETEIEDIKRYREEILALKAAGDAPMGLLEEIGKMSVSDGLKLLDAITNADEKQRSAFMQGYGEKNSLSDAISAELLPTLYETDVAKFGEDMSQKLIDGLKSKFGEVPDDFVTLGEQSSSSFSDGFMESFNKTMDKVRESICANLSYMTQFLSMSGANGGYTQANYNTSFVLNSSKDTTAQQLAAARSAALLERYRGGYDD